MVEPTTTYSPGVGFAGPNPGPQIPSQFGQPPAGYGPPIPNAFGQLPPPPAPPRRRVGAVVGAIVGALVVLGGLVVGAILLFGSATIDTERAEAEISRISQEQLGLTPSSVTCPEDVEVAAGSTFPCAAVLDGQEVTFLVRQDDDQGNVTINSDGFAAVSKIEELLAQQVSAEFGLDVTAVCGDGERVIVGGAGTAFSCVVTNTADPTDFVLVDGTITDNQGTVEFDL